MVVATRSGADKHLNRTTDPAAPWLHIDPLGAAAGIALAVIGVMMVYSATRGTDPEVFDTFYLERQSTFVVIGVGIMILAAAIDYHHLRLWSWPIYGFSLLLLMAVLSPAGIEVNGAQAWFEMGSIQLQPAEFAKLALIVMLAAYMSRYEGVLGLKQLLGCLVIAAVPMALILRQPDVGTVLIFAVVTIAMLLIGGIRLRHLVVLVVLGALGVALVINSPLLQEYQRDRLTSFIAPDENSVEAYNQEQAQIAIGNGGLTGTGFGEGSQTRGGLVPEQQTDFIFSVIGEELGFVGGAVTLALFAVLLWRVWRTAKIASDLFGTLLCVGVFAMLIFQMFQSVGMTLGIMPVTGIPLPFVSYGGSSALTSFIAIGIVINVHMRRYRV
jgi:rod shape determining protein RodA